MCVWHIGSINLAISISYRSLDGEILKRNVSSSNCKGDKITDSLIFPMTNDCCPNSKFVLSCEHQGLPIATSETNVNFNFQINLPQTIRVLASQVSFLAFRPSCCIRYVQSLYCYFSSLIFVIMRASMVHHLPFPYFFTAIITII